MRKFNMMKQPVMLSVKEYNLLMSLIRRNIDEWDTKEKIYKDGLKIIVGKNGDLLVQKNLNETIAIFPYKFAEVIEDI